MSLSVITVSVSERMYGHFYYRREALKSIIIVISSIRITLIVRSASGLLFWICKTSCIKHIISLENCVDFRIGQ